MVAMRSILKALFLVLFLVLLAFAGEFVVTEILDDSLTLNSSDPSNSVVYIQNGVSGAVTIKDPSTSIPITLNINYLLGSGSGVIVSKDGYIITAFHVVSDPQTLQNQLKLKRMSEEDINHYIMQAAVTEYVRYNPQLAREFNNNGDLTNFFIQNNLIRVDSARQDIKVKLASSSPISNYLNVQLVDTGNPDIDEDIALLKLNYRSDLPSLSISSSNLVGESIRVYGYPGNGSRTSLSLESSKGSIIRRVINIGGVTFYETSAPASRGYSGGPALDEKNRILGIIVYSIQSRGNNRSQTGTNSVFLSSNNLIQICKKNNVTINIS
ncbi:S1 family peptidase [Methanobacterium sp. ACI-7]|uniref:S1 family peptidase n=1 Tax=unclassified Methanobacterium TaxID=2627676 RepID=UPI0039C3E412